MNVTGQCYWIWWMSSAFNRSEGMDKELSLLSCFIECFYNFLDFYFATSSSPYYDNCLVLKNDGAEKVESLVNDY